MSNNKCENCIHNEVCDHNRLGYENCNSFKDKSLCVEVVRCKDCEHWKDVSLDTVKEAYWGMCIRPLGEHRYSVTSENDFCSYAEAKLKETGE